MPDYAVTFARSARRELEKLNPPYIARIVSRIDRLAQEPRPKGARSLRGSEDLWRVRVGDYRIIYHIDDQQRVIDIVRVRHRREAYR
jgi:mRNA interferase RelE/StbE